jgi:hypothetical protein
MRHINIEILVVNMVLKKRVKTIKSENFFSCLTLEWAKQILVWNCSKGFQGTIYET